MWPTPKVLSYTSLFGAHCFGTREPCLAIPIALETKAHACIHPYITFLMNTVKSLSHAYLVLTHAHSTSMNILEWLSWRVRLWDWRDRDERLATDRNINSYYKIWHFYETMWKLRFELWWTQVKPAALAIPPVANMYRCLLGLGSFPSFAPCLCGAKIRISESARRKGDSYILPLLYFGSST
jgi:hypothetical protein